MNAYDNGTVNDLAVAARFIRFIRTGNPALDLELRDIAERIAGIERGLRRPHIDRAIATPQPPTNLTSLSR